MSKFKYFRFLFLTTLLWGGLAYGHSVISSTSKPTFKFHGGATLWYYRPQQSWVDENFSIYDVYADTDVTYKNYGAHIDMRFRDNKFRGYYPSNFWFQQAYGFYRQPNYIIKIGKEYTHFGKFWDGSYYGNVLYFDGIVLNPDDGISWEGKLPHLRGWQMHYYLQYFVVDGTTNGSLDPWGQNGEGGLDGQETGDGAPIVSSLQTGRDTVSIPGSHRRNEVIARVEPIFLLPHNCKLKLGLNYEHLLSDITDVNDSSVVPERIHMHRYAADLTFVHNNWSIFFEWAHQDGLTALDFPLFNQPSRHIDYYWAGTRYKFGKFTVYYNYSDGFYHDENIHDITQVPGIGYQVNKYISSSFEYGYWYRIDAGSFSTNDNSLNFILTANI